MLSDTIVDMLLHLENEELALPLPDTHAQSGDCAGCEEHNTEIIMNFASDDEWDPPTLWHAKQSKYWNEWLAAMHEELEALKAKYVYKEVEELPPRRKVCWSAAR